jgi:hypothetical protein
VAFFVKAQLLHHAQGLYLVFPPVQHMKTVWNKTLEGGLYTVLLLCIALEVLTLSGKVAEKASRLQLW